MNSLRGDGAIWSSWHLIEEVARLVFHIGSETAVPPVGHSGENDGDSVACRVSNSAVVLESLGIIRLVVDDTAIRFPSTTSA